VLSSAASAARASATARIVDALSAGISSGRGAGTNALPGLPSGAVTSTSEPDVSFTNIAKSTMSDYSHLSDIVDSSARRRCGSGGAATGLIGDTGLPRRHGPTSRTRASLRSALSKSAQEVADRLLIHALRY
jgi:hypothetical protein